MNLNNDVAAFFHRTTEILDRPHHGYQNKILENFAIKKPVDSYKTEKLQKIPKFFK